VRVEGGRKIILANPCFSVSGEQMAGTLKCPRAAAPQSALTLTASWLEGWDLSLRSCIIIITNINFYYSLSLL